MGVNKKHIITFGEKYLKEDNSFNENDTKEYADCIESLKKVKNGIDIREVILWFNENDIDYYNKSDLEMYITYIEMNISK